MVLYQPEIPPNTGNIIRLCANTGCCLHLIEPLGFNIDDRALKRAGLDYHDFANLNIHSDFSSCQSHLKEHDLFTFSTHHQVRYDQCDYPETSVLVFGPETRGLPEHIRDLAPANQRVTLPMRENSRSLNLSNSVAVAVYEVWRQRDFRIF